MLCPRCEQERPVEASGAGMHCGNRMRLLATIEDPRVVEQVLTHLGLPSTPVRADPAQPPPPAVANLFADTPA